MPAGAAIRISGRISRRQAPLPADRISTALKGDGWASAIRPSGGLTAAPGREFVVLPRTSGAVPARA